MSLDVTLYTEHICNDESCTKEDNYYHSFNITHNLSTMAEHAGIYQAMWHPDALIDNPQACHIIIPLASGFKLLTENKEYLSSYAPDNGWGTYDGLLRIVKDYLTACIKYPNAYIAISR